LWLVVGSWSASVIQSLAGGLGTGTGEMVWGFGLEREGRLHVCVPVVDGIGVGLVNFRWGTFSEQA
jgi:hypothetical protein